MNFIERLVPYVIVASTAVGFTIAGTRYMQIQVNQQEQAECELNSIRRLIQINSTIGTIEYCAPSILFRN